MVNLLSEYDNEYNLKFEKEFEIDTGNGNYKGIICLWDKLSIAPSCSVGGKRCFNPFIKGLSILIADVQKLDYEMKIVFSETISKKFKGGIIGIPSIIPTIPKNNNTRFACEDFITLDKVISGKIKSIKADITLDFEPSPQLICKQKFLNYVNTCLVFNVFKEDGTVAKKDFKIVCRGGEEFGFNRSILCKISPVFERMLAHTSLKEYKNGRVEIIDTTPKTIKAFKNMLSLNYIQMEELTSEMLLFADKYEICFLYQLCQDHLCTAITKENVFDVIRSANYTHDEKLNRKCSEFMQANLGAFDIGGDPEWTLYKTPTATIPKATASGLGINYILFFTIMINIVICGMPLFRPPFINGRPQDSVSVFGMTLPPVFEPFSHVFIICFSFTSFVKRSH